MVHCFVDEDAMQWLKGSLSQLILYVCEQDAHSRWRETVKMSFDDTANVDLSSPPLRGISTSASQKTVFVDYETWKAQAGMPILQANVYKVIIE